MNIVRTNNQKHARINLDKIIYFYSCDSFDRKIVFKYYSSERSWTFETTEKRDKVLEQLDIVSNSQNIETIITL